MRVETVRRSAGRGLPENSPFALNVDAGVDEWWRGIRFGEVLQVCRRRPAAVCGVASWEVMDLIDTHHA